MAGRVNTKFVMILTIALVVMVGGILGLWWMAVYRRDPDRYVARAEQFVEQGLYKDAVKQLGRAQAYEEAGDRKIRILFRLADVHRMITTDNMEEASSHLRQLIGCWQAVRRIDPTNLAATERLLEFYHQDARSNPRSMSRWDHLYTTTNDMLNVVPDMILAKRFRGIAQTARMQRIDLNDAARRQAREDLNEALEADPDDAEIIHQLAVWHLAEADTQRRLGRTEKVQALEAEALRLVREDAAGHPDRIVSKLNLLRVLAVLGHRPESDPDLLAEARGLLDELESELASGESPDQAMETANSLLRLDDESVELADGRQTRRGMVRAEKLLRQVARANPNDLQVLSALGNLLKQQGRYADAIEFFQLVRKDRPISVSMEAMRLSHYQTMAIKELADLYLAEYGRATDEQEKAAWLAQAHEAADDLAERAAGSGWVDLIQGKLALVDGNIGEAVKKLDSANKQLEGTNVDALRLSAQALLQMGETGAAAARLEQLIAHPLGRRMIKPYLDLARLRLRANDVDRALSHIQTILNVRPDHADALLLKSEILARRARALSESDPAASEQAAREAIEALDAIAEQDRRPVVQQRARLEQLAGRPEAARDLLADFYERHPDDLVMLQQLIRLDKQLGHDEAAMAAVDQAIARFPERAALQVIAQSLRGESEAVSEQIEQVLAAENDPVLRELKLYSFYRQTNRPEEADQHLAEATRIAPDHEQVVKLQFELALADERWDEAQALAERAAAMNDGAGLDQAQGRFWIGRRQLAQGRHREAVATLEQAVRDMPVSSNGWLLLGDARRGVQDLAGAEAAYRQSVELKPENPQAWRRLFAIHDARGQHEQALADMQHLLQYSGNDRNVYMAYLDYLARHGDPAEALARREKLAEQEPDNQANRRAMAQLLLQLGRPDEARQIIDQLVADDPDDRANVWMKARYLAAQNQYGRGEELVREYVHGLGDQATVDDWLLYARYLRGGGRPDAAVAAYHQAVEREDGTVMVASRELADWRFGRQEYEQAVPRYEQILEASGNDPVVWRRYVEALVHQGELDKADRQLNALMAAHDADAQMHLLEGLIAEGQDDREAASAAYDAAVHLEPANPSVYIQRARFRMHSDSQTVRGLARTDLERAVEMDQNAILPREMLVRWHLQRQDPTAAINELQRLITVRPTYALARVQLAQLYISRGPAAAGDLDRLLDDSEKRLPNLPMWDQLRAQLALMQLPANASAQDRARAYRGAAEQLAEAYEKERTAQRAAALIDAYLTSLQPDKALAVIDDWPEVRDQSPQFQAMRARAIALQGSDRLGEAKRVFGRALEMAADNPQAIRAVIAQIQPVLRVEDQLELLEPRTDHDPSGYTELVVSQLWLGQGRHEEAIERLSQLHQRLPENTVVLRTLASACYLAGRPADSRKHYEALLVQTPDDLMALNNLAYMLADELGAPEQAIAMAERAVELAGRDEIQRANVLDTLGWVQYMAGRINEATTTLRQSVRLNPMPANCLHLGTVLAEQNPTEAREQLIRARGLAERRKDQDTMRKVDQLLQKLDAAVSAQ